MAYPILYKATETNFEHLGVSVLSDASKCYVSREKNGIYILEFDYPVNGKDVDKIKEGMYIKSDTGYRTKNQRFIVSKITKTQNEFKIYCQHISQVKTTMNAIRPDITVTGSAMMALSTWRDNLLDSRDEFFVNSDITTVNSTTWKVENIENARDALGGKAGSILDVWGGEYEFDNLNITLHKSMGIDNPTIIAYGKNLLDLEQEQSILETYTSVFPFKKYTDDNNREQLITLPEILLDSTHLNKFTHRRILKVDFSSDENIKTVEQLRSKAESYIKSNNVGVPKTNLKINYQDLSKVEGVFDNPALEQIDLCDRLKVYYSELGIMNESAKVVKVIWDVILEENHEIEVGDGRSSFTDSNSAKLEALQVKNDSLLARINTLIAEQEAAFDRYFNEKSKVIEDAVKIGTEKAQLSSEEKIRKMGEAFDEKVNQFRNQVSATVEDYNRQFQATNLEISKNRVEATKQIQALSERVNNIQDISNNETVRELRGLVNGATSKVTELETSITREFTAVKKKNEDGLSAVKVEFKKGVDGLTSKISSLEEYKNQDGTRTENLKQWVQRDTASQLSHERTEIIRNVRDSIPTSIGGRNYITDSKNLKAKTHWGSNKWDEEIDGDAIILTKKGGSEKTGFWFNLTDLVKNQFQNETLTWSIEIKASRNITLNSVGFETNGQKRIDISTNWTRISHTFTNRFSKFYMFTFNDPTTNFNNGDKIYIRLPKLETGNVATDWTPAPEDNNDFVKNTEFSSKFTESARGITNQLSALETYKNQDGVRVANMQIWVQNNTANQLTAERRNIEKWVNDKGYATTSVVENKVQETANSFSREISNVRNSIPTSIGGRNYIPNSNFAKELENWEMARLNNSGLNWQKGHAITNFGRGLHIWGTPNGDYKGLGTMFNLTAKQGEKLTLSMDLGKDALTQNAILYIGLHYVVDNDIVLQQWQTLDLATQNFEVRKYKRISKTFTVSADMNRCRLMIHTQNNKLVNFYIDNIKLEKGDISTDWTPAPEDNIQSINELNTWKQTATQTLNTVSSGLNDTVKHSQLRIGADGIDFGSNKVFNGRNLASILSVSPESIKAITDKLIISPANENLVLPEFRESKISNSRDTWLTPKLNVDDIQVGDEYVFSGSIFIEGGGYPPHNVNFILEYKSKNNGVGWIISRIMTANQDLYSAGKSYTLKVNTGYTDIEYIRLGIQQETFSNFKTLNMYNARIYKKKSAELIVDGSIEGRQIKAETLETGHHKAESITSEIIAANAVKAKHVLIDDGLINNLITHNAFINKLWAQQAFINKLNAVKIKSTQIDTDTLNGVTITGRSKIRVGENGYLEPFGTGVRFVLPHNNSETSSGVGVQFNATNNSLGKGISVFNIDNIKAPNDAKKLYDEYLLTVHGQIQAGFPFYSNKEGRFSNYLGSVVVSNNSNNDPIRPWGFTGTSPTYSKISWLSWLWGTSSGPRIMFGYPYQNNVNFFAVKIAESYSDARLKKNIKKSTESALDLIEKLKFKKFSWKKDNQITAGQKDVKVGLIAQDVQLIDESLVTKCPEYLEIEHFRLTMYALKAIQELSQQNKELKNKLEELING